MPSATEAYRLDRANRTEAFSSMDGEWVATVTLVTHAARVPQREERRLMRQADDLARTCFGEEEVRRLSRLEWRAAPRRMDAIVLLSIAMHEAGTSHLALALVEGALATKASLTPLQRGRLDAARARLTHYFGEHDLAVERYLELERVARKLGSAELLARSSLGLGAVAQLRGNYPEMLRQARRAASFAMECGAPQLRRRASTGLMMAAAQLHRYDEALASAWQMYRAAHNDPVGEATSLVALGELLLRLGEPPAAYVAFAQLLSGPHPARVILPALSGFASAAARLRPPQPNDVRWAAGEVERFRKTPASRFAFAQALLECAETLREIGSVERADAFRDEAFALAEARGYNELSVKAEPRGITGTNPKRAAASTRIVRYFDNQPQPRLPKHVVTAGEPAVFG